MEELIGRQFKYKGSNDIKIVREIKNNRVVFTDNGSVDIAKITENFDEVIVSKPNPDTFFEPEMSSNFGNLFNQMEEFRKNPAAFVQNSQNDIPQVGANGEDLSGISPETLQNWKQAQEKARQDAILAEEAKKNDPWLKQFGDMNGEVRRVEANSNQEELDRVQRVNRGEEIPPQNQYSNSNSNSNTTINVNNALPKMKKTFKIKLNIEINEMIPKVEDIKAVENLFEVSLVEGIAKEIANKYLNDRELFENMILSELDKIVNKKKAKKPTAKKTVK